MHVADIHSAFAHAEAVRVADVVSQIAVFSRFPTRQIRRDAVYAADCDSFNGTGA